MQCPICKTNLVMSERQGVEIDYCPNCRGVWLDRGELDKIIERLTSQEVKQGQQHYTPDNHVKNQPRYEDEYRDNDKYKKKKESWLGEIFDF